MCFPVADDFGGIGLGHILKIAVDTRNVDLLPKINTTTSMRFPVTLRVRRRQMGVRLVRPTILAGCGTNSSWNVNEMAIPVEPTVNTINHR